MAPSAATSDQDYPNKGSFQESNSNQEHAKEINAQDREDTRIDKSDSD